MGKRREGREKKRLPEEDSVERERRILARASNPPLLETAQVKPAFLLSETTERM